MHYFKLIVAYAFTALCALVIFTFPHPSFGKDVPTMVYTDPTGALTLRTGPCTEPSIVKHMPPAVRAQFRDGSFTATDGAVIAICWAYDEENGVVHVTSPALAANGATFPIPASAFAPGTSIELSNF